MSEIDLSTALEPSYLTLPQVAEVLTTRGIPTSRASAYRLAQLPGFPLLKIQGRLFCRHADLFAWINRQTVT